jgi:hypothetical protein
MGFLHPEDMANEVRDALSIDIRIATSITNAINQRIFAPIRADIDKVYNPNPEELIAPKIVEEIRPAQKISVPASLVIPAPASLSATIPVTPKQEPIKPAAPKPAIADEFARAGTNKPTSATPAPMPKPMVLQTESISRPITNAPNFRVPTIAENIMGAKGASMPLPPRTAVVEFGGMPLPKTPTVPQPSTAPKVTPIRYGSENSTAPAKPPVPEPMRTVTEITPETLKVVAPAPKPSTQSSFTPISQIPIPSSIAQKPFVSAPSPIPAQAKPMPIAQTSPAPQKSISQIPAPAPIKPTPATVMPSMPPKPMPQTPTPAGQPEKVIQKDYSR